MARREIPACGASYLGVAGCLPTRNGVSLATRLIAALVQTEDSSAVRWTSATFVGDCSTARRMRISATGGRLLVRDASYQRFVISRSMSGRPTTSLRDACRRRLLFSLHPENHARPSCDGLVPAALVSLRSKKSRAPSRRILACGTSYSRFARRWMLGRPMTASCLRRLLFSLRSKNDARPSCDGLVPAALVSLRSKESRAPYGALGNPCLRRW